MKPMSSQIGGAQRGPHQDMLWLNYQNVRQREIFENRKKWLVTKKNPLKLETLKAKRAAWYIKSTTRKKTLPTQSSKLYMAKLSFKNGGIRYTHTHKRASQVSQK